MHCWYNIKTVIDVTDWDLNASELIATKWSKHALSFYNTKCFCWCIGSYMTNMLCFQEGPQRKKRKSEAVQEEKADLLAMGTAAGSVLIYSTAKGALHCTLVSETSKTCIMACKLLPMFSPLLFQVQKCILLPKCCCSMWRTFSI